MPPERQPNSGRLKRWRAERRLRKFHEKCDRLRIPQDVRARMLKAGFDTAPDWYAGRQDPPRVTFL